MQHALHHLLALLEMGCDLVLQVVHADNDAHHHAAAELHTGPPLKLALSGRHGWPVCAEEKSVTLRAEEDEKETASEDVSSSMR